MNTKEEYPYSLKKDFPLYQVYKDVENKDYLIFIKSTGRYYSLGFYTIKSAIAHAENMIKEGRL